MQHGTMQFSKYSATLYDAYNATWCCALQYSAIFCNVCNATGCYALQCNTWMCACSVCVCVCACVCVCVCVLGVEQANINLHGCIILNGQH